MLNHARTLLVNVDGTADGTACVAGELIDPAFRAVEYPSPLLKVRRALFGAAPDMHMLAYRSRQLLAAVHASPLAYHVTAFDPRITYDFTDETAVRPEAFAPVVSGSGDTTSVLLYDDPDAPDATGRMYHAFLVTAVAGTVTVERTTTPFSILEFSQDANAKIELPGCGVRVRLTAPGDQAWKVEITARPAKGLPQLAADASALGEPVYNYLFGVVNVEPFVTFRNLWFRNPALPPRLAGLVCAILYRSEQERVAA